MKQDGIAVLSFYEVTPIYAPYLLTQIKWLYWNYHIKTSRYLKIVFYIIIVEVPYNHRFINIWYWSYQMMENI